MRAMPSLIFDMGKNSATGAISCRAQKTSIFSVVAGLPSGGTVRVSLGLVSDISDVERFLDFAERTYRDREPDQRGLASRLRCLSA